MSAGSATGTAPLHDKTPRVRDALRQLMGEPSMVGATLVSRDGLCLLNYEERIIAPETLSAMSAALVGAAETAFYHLGEGRSIRVTAETENSKLIAIGATEDILLVVITSGTSPLNVVMPRVEQAAAMIRDILEGD